MISGKILNNLTSRNDDPGYTIVITGFETGEECNCEYLKINMHQLNKSISEIEEGVNFIDKEFTIRSVLDYDEENDLFLTQLAGNSNIKSAETIIQEGENINSHYIEALVTNIASEIDVEFNHTYRYIPAINITMDKSTENLFRNYEYEFQYKETTIPLDYNEDYNLDELSNDEIIVNHSLHEKKLIKRDIIGVKIKFNKLRSKITYPTINILIIGDVIDTDGN